MGSLVKNLKKLIVKLIAIIVIVCVIALIMYFCPGGADLLASVPVVGSLLSTPAVLISVAVGLTVVAFILDKDEAKRVFSAVTNAAGNLGELVGGVVGGVAGGTADGLISSKAFKYILLGLGCYYLYQRVQSNDEPRAYDRGLDVVDYGAYYDNTKSVV